MKQVLIAVATALIALTTMFSSAADAGFKARIGIGVLALAPHVIAASKAQSAKRKYRKRKYQAAKRRRAKKKVYAKKKAYAKKRRAKRATIAKVKTAPKTPPVVDYSENENSTISTALLETTENDTETTSFVEETVAENTAVVTPVANTGNQLSCKKFFAAVGMTLTVPCE